MTPVRPIDIKRMYRSTTDGSYVRGDGRRVLWDPARSRRALRDLDRLAVLAFRDQLNSDEARERYARVIRLVLRLGQ